MTRIYKVFIIAFQNDRNVQGHSKSRTYLSKTVTAKDMATADDY